MPPDSIAGLMALAAAPPGAASSAGPPLPEPLSASLFAAFLAQSGTPAPKADVPKTIITLAPNTNPKQTLLDTPVLPNMQVLLDKQTLPDKQTLLKPKTMDTLPTLSFPPSLKVKVKASELLLHQTLIQPALVHSVSAEAKPAPETLAAGLPVVGQVTAAPVLLVAFVPGQPAVFVPTPVASAPSPAVPSIPVVPRGFETRPQIAPSPILSGPIAPNPITPREVTSGPALPIPFRLPQTQASIALPTLPQASPALLLPVPTLAAPLLTTEPALSAAKAPEPMTLSTVKVKPATVIMTAVMTNALPRIASPVLAAPQAQTAPQAQVPSIVPQEPTTLPPVIIAAVQQDVPTPAVGVPSLIPPKLAPAKTTATLTAALKPSEKNADTSTRTLQGQVQEVILKAVVSKVGTPAAAPGPLPMPEKHTAEQGPSVTAESGTNSGLPAPAVGTTIGAIKTDVKPLTAGERAEVVRQAADGVGAVALPAKPGEAQQMSVQLHPKDWGSLQVSVTVAPSQEAGAAKTVTAHIVAETPQVKAALQSQTGALHQALRASGLHLEHLTVSVKTAEAKISEAKALEVKPAAQSASAGFASGQGQSDKSEQSYGQPNPSVSSGTNGFGPNSGASGGAGGSQSNRQGQPQAVVPVITDAEPDDSGDSPVRVAAGRIDTHA